MYILANNMLLIVLEYDWQKYPVLERHHRNNDTAHNAAFL